MSEPTRTFTPECGGWTPPGGTRLDGVVVSPSTQPPSLPLHLPAHPHPKRPHPPTKPDSSPPTGQAPPSRAVSSHRTPGTRSLCLRERRAQHAGGLPIPPPNAPCLPLNPHHHSPRNGSGSSPSPTSPSILTPAARRSLRNSDARIISQTPNCALVSFR